MREAQAEFERAQSQRDKASASRRKSFEQAQATGLTAARRLVWGDLDPSTGERR